MESKESYFLQTQFEQFWPDGQIKQIMNIKVVYSIYGLL